MGARLPVSVCALVLALTDCASSGVEVMDSQLTQFQKGVTTEGDVLRALGPATTTSSNSDGSAMLVYTGVHARAKAASFIPIVGIFAGGATAEATSVAFRFGPDHRLIDYWTTHGQTDVGMGGARTVDTTTTTNVVPTDSAPLAALQAPRASGVSQLRLGVHCMQVTPEVAQVYHIPNDTGVQVMTVGAGSVAEAGGIKVGDVILKYGDRSVREISDLSDAIAATAPGAEIPITVWRRTGESVVDVRFNGSVTTQSGGQEQRPLQPTSPPAAPQDGATPSPSHVRLGVHCTQVTPKLAQKDGLPAETGLQVATVEAGSVAEADGIHVGDVLVKYGEHSLNQISDLATAIAATAPGDNVPITVWRPTGELVVQVQY